MPDGLLQTQLSEGMYRNGAVVPILLKFEQRSIDQRYDLQHLVTLVQEEPTQEHILSQEPCFDFSILGFADRTEFEDYVNRIGNLTLLTSSENTRCGNRTPEIKMAQPDLYPSSRFAGPRLLAHAFSISPAPFNKAEVLARGTALADVARDTWAIW